MSDVAVEYYRTRDESTLRAISGLSVEVAEGGFVSIVGPSGCGKTTLLKIIDGQVDLTEGSVHLHGVPLQNARSEHAMVFQESLLFPWYTVLRNAAYGLECRGVPRKEAEEVAKEYVTLVGLGGFEAHYPHELSGGMQQRINLARALAVEPSLLLMDEPFAALDAQTRELMQQELLRIWRETSATVLFVTHQISEAVYLSDRVLVMSGRPGRIVDDITIDFPRPRPLSVKRTEAFLDYEDRIWEMIEAQVRSDFDSQTSEANRR